MRRGGAACAFPFIRWGTVGDPPRPAPRQRAGPACGLVLLGDPTSLKDVSDPHCCAWPQRCSCLCRRLRRPRRVLRHGPAASCSAAMASTARFQSPDVLGCLPGHRDRLARRDSTGLDQGPLLGPVVPRGGSEGPAKRRPAAFDARAAGAYGPARGASVDPPLPPRNTAAWRIRADGVHPPMRSAILAASGSRGTWASASTSNGRRAPAGLPPAVRVTPV